MRCYPKRHKPKLNGLAAIALSLVFAGCSMPTQPIESRQSPSGDDLLQGVAQSTVLLNSTEAGRSQAPSVSGSFRQDDLVIMVHGLRLNPGLFVQATYDLDPESSWPIGWAAGMDFLTSIDGRLWEEIPGSSLPENTGAAAMLRETGEGFSYSVPLSAMHDPAGPITFAIIVGSYGGGYATDDPTDQPYYFRGFGRAECRQCTNIDRHP